MFGIISTVLYILISFVCFLVAFTNRVHMFQLNAYKYVFMRDWIKTNFKTLFLKSLLPVLSLLMLFLPWDILKLVAIIPNLIFLVLNLPKKAKKPLVYTTRVKRQYVTATVLFLILW
ncbi:MAG: hypothetical protein E7621_01660 [Ruminococcaceae bacterium]|nr:hypothetical protein [Oscillospiraceae bacterium]